MNNKMMLVLCGVLLTLFFVSDFSQRVMLGQWNNTATDSVNNDTEWPTVEKIEPGLLTNVLSQLEQYDVVVKKEEETKTDEELAAMSLAEQENQQGNLDKIYAGDLIITLKGTVYKDSTYALVQEQHIKTKEITLRKMTVGDEMYGYFLQKVGQKSALLAAGERKIDLMLYQVSPVHNG